MTGERLAVRNTLSEREQAEVRGFLRELVGGRTLLLLGSRGDEDWLQPDPLRGTRHLRPARPGLRGAERAGAGRAGRGGAPPYHEQAAHRDDFRRLLRLLGGYPLAMEVVLANLAQRHARAR